MRARQVKSLFVSTPTIDGVPVRRTRSDMLYRHPIIDRLKRVRSNIFDIVDTGRSN